MERIRLWCGTLLTSTLTRNTPSHYIPSNNPLLTKTVLPSVMRFDCIYLGIVCGDGLRCGCSGGMVFLGRDGEGCLGGREGVGGAGVGVIPLPSSLVSTYRGGETEWSEFYISSTIVPKCILEVLLS